MNNYNKEVLPRKNISKPIYLKLGIAIRAFDSINQVEGTMETNIWLRYWWKDRILSWNPQDYGNTTNIKIKPFSQRSSLDIPRTFPNKKYRPRCKFVSRSNTSPFQHIPNAYHGRYMQISGHEFGPAP